MPQNPINIEAAYTCRHFELPATYNYPHDHEDHQEYELIYVEKGPYYDISEENAVELHSGDAVIYGRNYSHKNNCDGKHSASIFITTFLCDSELMRRFFPDNTRTIVRINPEQRAILALAFGAGVKAYDINGRFNKLKSKPPHIHRQIYINYIEILFLDIIKSMMKEAPKENVFFEQDSNCTEVTAKVIAFLENNLEFDGEKLSERNMMLCYFDSNNDTVEVGNNVTVTTIRTPNSNKYMAVGYSYDSALVMEFSICKNFCNTDVLSISDMELNGLMRWLNRKKFCKFKPT